MYTHEKHGWDLPANLSVGDTLIYRVKEDNPKRKDFRRTVRITQKLEDRFVAETEKGVKVYIGSWNAEDFELQPKES